MADNQNILQRLGNLFQSNIIIKKNDDGGVVVKDINMMQRGLVSNFIDRYSRLHSGQQYWTEQWAQKHQVGCFQPLPGLLGLLRDQFYNNNRFL